MLYKSRGFFSGKGNNCRFSKTLFTKTNPTFVQSNHCFSPNFINYKWNYAAVRFVFQVCNQHVSLVNKYLCEQKFFLWSVQRSRNPAAAGLISDCVRKGNGLQTTGNIFHASSLALLTPAEGNSLKKNVTTKGKIKS